MLYHTCIKRGIFVLSNDTSWAQLFSHYWLLNVNQIVIVTYFCRRNPLSPYILLFPISSNQSLIYTFPQTEQHLLEPLMDQLWTTVWNGKYPKLQLHALCRIDQVIKTFTGGHRTAWTTSRSFLHMHIYARHSNRIALKPSIFIYSSICLAIPRAISLNYLMRY